MTATMNLRDRACATPEYQRYWEARQARESVTGCVLEHSEISELDERLCLAAAAWRATPEYRAYREYIDKL